MYITRIKHRCKKTPYDSFFAAQKVINWARRFHRYSKLNHTRTPRNIPKRVYKCEICGEYHITSKRNKQDVFK